MKRSNIIKVFDAAAMATATLTSKIIDLRHTDNLAIQLIFASTGTPVGIFDVQGSLDYEPGGYASGKPANAGNWASITLSAVPAAVGSAGNIMIEINQTAIPWIRVTYTKTSGTGTLNGYIAVKEI